MPSRQRRKLSIDQYVDGVLQRDRAVLGRAITLVESHSPADMERAQELLVDRVQRFEKRAANAFPL